MWYYEGGIRIEPDWNVKGALHSDFTIKIISLE